MIKMDFVTQIYLHVILTVAKYRPIYENDIMGLL